MEEIKKKKRKKKRKENIKMIRQSIINRINKYAKNRGLKVTKMKELEPCFNGGYKFNEIRFITNDDKSHLFSEMNVDKRHWFIV